MNEFYAIFSLFLACAFVTFATYKLLDARLNALYATMLGLGGLVIVDIGKYYFFDQQRVGWVGDEIFQAVSLLIWISTAAIFLAYLVFSRMLATAKAADKQIVFRKSREGFLKLLEFSLIPLSLFYSYYVDRTAFGGIIAGGLLKGLIVALFIYGLYKNNKYAIIVSMVSLVVGVDDTSRRAYVAIALPVIVMALSVFREKIGHIKFKTKILFVLLLAGVFVFLNAMRSSHDFGEGFNPENRIENTVHYITTLKSIDTFYNTSFIYTNFPSYWDYYYGETYLSVLLAPVPRALWQDKPASLGSQLGLMQVFGYRGFDQDLWEKASMYSLSPGFVGEAHANFGSIGVVLISLLLGFVAAFYDKRILGKVVQITATPWVIFLSSFILVHRGDFYVSVNYQIFMFLAAVAFYKFFFKTASASKRKYRHVDLLSSYSGREMVPPRRRSE